MKTIISWLKRGFQFLFTQKFLMILFGIGVGIMILQFIFGYDIIEPIAIFFSNFMVVPSLIIIALVLIGGMIYYGIKRLFNKK